MLSEVAPKFDEEFILANALRALKSPEPCQVESYPMRSNQLNVSWLIKYWDFFWQKVKQVCKSGTSTITESYSLGNYHPAFNFKVSWGCSLLTKLATAYCITLISSLTTLRCFAPWYILSGGDTIAYLRYKIISFNVAGNNDGN